MATTELALAAYRPRGNSDEELVGLLREDVATLREQGHVTDRPVPLLRTQRGELLLVLEWSSEHAVEDAHRDPAVLDVWRRKDALAEYVAPRDLAGADVPFARWAVVDDL